MQRHHAKGATWLGHGMRAWLGKITVIVAAALALFLPSVIAAPAANAHTGGGSLKNVKLGNCAALFADAGSPQAPFVLSGCQAVPSEEFNFYYMGKVTASWPFDRTNFDSLYAGDTVVEVRVASGCMTQDYHGLGIEWEPCTGGQWQLWVENGIVQQVVNVGATDYNDAATFLCGNHNGYNLFAGTNNTDDYRCDSPYNRWTYIVQ